MSALADQFTRFLDERRWLLNVTPKTLEWYEEMFKLLRRLQPTLTEPSDLTKPTLNQFVVKMRERGLSAVSCNTRLKAVNVFVAWLHTEGLLATKFHVPPLRTEKRVRSILSTEQVKRLIQFKPKTNANTDPLSWRSYSWTRACGLTKRARYVLSTLAEQPISLEEAARRYGGFNGRLETVEPSITTLSGGPLKVVERHSCVFEGRRFAHIVLRYRNEMVSLLVSDEPRSVVSAGVLAGVREKPSGLPATGGFRVAAFRTSQHLVFVVSSLNDDDLQEVARAMARPVSQALSGA